MILWTSEDSAKGRRPAPAHSHRRRRLLGGLILSALLGLVCFGAQLHALACTITIQNAPTEIHGDGMTQYQIDLLAPSNIYVYPVGSEGIEWVGGSGGVFTGECGTVSLHFTATRPMSMPTYATIGASVNSDGSSPDTAQALWAD